MTGKNRVYCETEAQGKVGTCTALLLARNSLSAVTRKYLEDTLLCLKTSLLS